MKWPERTLPTGNSSIPDAAAPATAWRIDLDSDADTRLLAELGVTRDGLFDALGAEL
jgi:hypothetical protein